jgi:microcystin-dependent protein
MSDNFLGEIRTFAGTFAPKGWALCNGQVLSIGQNTALFALLGTTYGGNGVSTFALPNLQGTAAINQGQGTGLSSYSIGSTGGSVAVSLTDAQMPSHQHTLTQAGFSPPAVSLAGTSNVPQGGEAFAAAYDAHGAAVEAYIPATGSTNKISLPSATPINLTTNQTPAVTDPAGESQPHNNLQPYLVLNFIIALQGIFPAQS